MRVFCSTGDTMSRSKGPIRHGRRAQRKCAVSPLEGEYEPGVPESGFLYPAFKDRSTAGEYINLYEKDAGHSESVWQKLLK